MDLRWYRSWGTSYFDITLPSVLCSLWKAPDGRIGLVLYNISARDQPVDITIPGEQALADRAASVLYPQDGSLKPTVTKQAGTATGIRTTLAPRSPAIIAWQ